MTAPARALDVAVVGGGIVGLAVAHALLEARPRLRLVVVEKEPRVAAHQTGHNSGVVHSGLYYRPGSLKARLCVDGAERMRRYCTDRGLPYQPVGKVIVAVDRSELPALAELERRGRENGVPGLRRVDRSGLLAIEPNAAGIEALHSPTTGIVDYRQVAESLAREVRAAGGDVWLGTPVRGGRADATGARLDTDRGPVTASLVVTCAGLHADRVASALGASPGLRIVPFRGEYYHLTPSGAALVRGLIYPVADPRLPFLGVHLTRTVGGGVEAGPNAVWAPAREGYRRGRLDVRDAADALGYVGFWRLGRRFWRTAAYEYRRSRSRHLFGQSLRRLVPALQDGDLAAGGSGVRAQAVSPDGRLIDDFEIAASPGALHVLNAPSPAATASLAIGRHIAALALDQLGVV